MNTIAAFNATTVRANESPKALGAGTQFEAVLMNAVLGPLENSFVHLPGGKKEDQASQNYGGLAMQALTTGLAHAGGIGVGKIIIEALLKHSGNRADANR